MKTRKIFLTVILFSVFALLMFNGRAQGYSLQFNAVILVNNSGTVTVPDGKVWKIESVPTTNTLIPSVGYTDNTNYSVSKTIEINSNVVVISRAVRYTENNQRYNSESSTDIGIAHATELPLWLPEKTTLKTGTNALYISVIEFNLVSP